MNETNAAPGQKAAARRRRKSAPAKLKPNDCAAAPVEPPDNTATIAALRTALAKKRDRVNEWRRCRLELPISQVERLIRLIAEDERALHALGASEPSLAPAGRDVAKSPVPRHAPHANGHQADVNPFASYNGGGVIRSEAPRSFPDLDRANLAAVERQDRPTRVLQEAEALRH